MNTYTVEASKSEENMGNAISFYKEDGKVWLSLSGMEERGFTVEETKEIITKLEKCLLS